MNYKDDSSVCRAGIHSGIIDNELGGKMYVSLSGPKSNFKGLETNGIKSEDYADKWDNSFIINQYVKHCPIDFFKNR
jgi:hypothetical protein